LRNFTESKVVGEEACKVTDGVKDCSAFKQKWFFKNGVECGERPTWGGGTNCKLFG
jgi:hypothetical protein